MIYDLSKELDKGRFRTRVNFLYTRGSYVELTEHKEKRTLPQNKYLHLLLQYLALSLGENLDYVKDTYYKCICNRELFVYEKYDERIKRNIKRMRSSSDLTTEEMSLSIDRLKNWASQELGIYLPDAEKPEEITQAERDIQANRQWT